MVNISSKYFWFNHGALKEGDCICKPSDFKIMYVVYSNDGKKVMINEISQSEFTGPEILKGKYFKIISQRFGNIN